MVRKWLNLSKSNSDYSADSDSDSDSDAEQGPFWSFQAIASFWAFVVLFKDFLILCCRNL